jgi:phenylacetic acid degradation operon negative regulatory protein
VRTGGLKSRLGQKETVDVTRSPYNASPRSGSATSLVLTIVGLYLRRLGGHISTADLVALAGEAGVSAPLARTSIARLKKRGILTPDAVGSAAGYRLARGAADMLEHGDRRIFHVRHMSVDDPWCVVSFSIPESKRAVRGQLRRRLAWIGAGMLASGLWILPDFLRGEVEEILADLGVRECAVLLRTEQPIVAGSIQDAVATWWDLRSLAELHISFAEVVRGILRDADGETRAAFAGYVGAIDSWRVIPYLDPGLAPEVLPDGWPGRETSALFNEVSSRLAGPAWSFVEECVGATEEAARAN